MLWHPEDHHHGDVTIIKVGDTYHLFTNCDPADDDDRANRGGRVVVSHATSKDCFTWEERLTDFGDHPLGARPDGTWDARSIMHIDVLHHDNKWWMYYTATDRIPADPPQRQTVGLAVSEDGYHFERVQDAPVSVADPRWYEQSIPEEANTRKNLVGRTWYRDPFIFPTGNEGEWGMTVVARDKAKHPLRNGCLSLAVSRDLVHWESHPPLYSPGRFHTIETPSLFEHNGRHYIVFMSHTGWGQPYSTTDLYQTAGDFYAVSEDGALGPYRQVDDEVLVGAMGYIRCGAQRLIDNHDGTFLHYGWLRLPPTNDDIAVKPPRGQALTSPKLVKFTDDGAMHVTYNSAVEKFTASADFVADGEYGNFIFKARVTMKQGLRAGIRFRQSPEHELYAVADLQNKRIEFGSAGSRGFIDARCWRPRETFDLRIVAWNQSIEVYVDDRLMIHQVRYREQCGRISFMMDDAQANFSDIELRTFN